MNQVKPVIDKEESVEVNLIDAQIIEEKQIATTEISTGARPKDTFINNSKCGNSNQGNRMNEPPLEENRPGNLNIEIKLKNRHSPVGEVKSVVNVPIPEELTVDKKEKIPEAEIELMQEINQLTDSVEEQDEDGNASSNQSEYESFEEEDEDSNRSEGTNQEDLSPPPIPEQPTYVQKSESKDFKEVKKLEEDGKEHELGATGFDKSKIKVKVNSQKKAVEEKDLINLMEELEKLEELDLIPNTEEFECPVCLSDIPSGGGVVLKECIHNFCKECLANAVEFCEDAVVKCPYRDNNYSCASHLLDREVKNLVSPKIYEKHLKEVYEKQKVKTVKVSIVKHQIAQDGVFLWTTLMSSTVQSVKNRTALIVKLSTLEKIVFNTKKNFKKVVEMEMFTRQQLNDWRRNSHEMPKVSSCCLKKSGCDWLKCCICDTEICWVTKGPRWGPAGRGDTSGGCRCTVNGVKCHPLCKNCH
ncbi:RanBP-type and C3HC4-type zinc finger-containing protein 1 [Nymphon striatum]|nr:RanBP-type and C3HC4-type zinc finger-containing protein 1 [Nymphon striatum]